MTVTTRPFPLTRIRHASNFPKYGRRYIVNAQNHEHGYDRIPLSRQTDCKKLIGPSLQYSNLESLEVQLSALKNNNDPYLDHGIEVLYRFAGIDPWSRSNYFGRSLDLGRLFNKSKAVPDRLTFKVKSLWLFFRDVQDNLKDLDGLWTQSASLCLSITRRMRYSLLWNYRSLIGKQG